MDCLKSQVSHILIVQRNQIHVWVSGESKEANPIHYISALSGPILTWAVASLYIYIETHPVLQMPSYWYEHDILTLVATLPLFLGITILQGEYWAKFPYNGTFMSFVILYGF